VADDVFDDLRAEQQRLEAMLWTLPPSAWNAPSRVAGWSVSDVVLHLAQTEETVVATIARPGALDVWNLGDDTLDVAVDHRVRAERDAAPAAVFARWRTAHRAAHAALVGADPQASVPWATAPLRPATLATTRLAEHWAHGLDIAIPLGIEPPDTARLRHIAWLAHRTLPYAFTLAGMSPHPVYCRLVAPDGTIWRYGPRNAPSRILGSAGAFCRVAARRLPARESGLLAVGPHGTAALDLLRTYAA
jgi:uncharacterized protein (TIGR03084 family)